VIWLRIRFWLSMLGVEIRNSLDFLWVFFSTFRGYRYSRRCRCLTGCPPRGIPKVVDFG
jgi:hypothetical protein